MSGYSLALLLISATKSLCLARSSGDLSRWTLNVRCVADFLLFIAFWRILWIVSELQKQTLTSLFLSCDCSPIRAASKLGFSSISSNKLDILLSSSSDASYDNPNTTTFLDWSSSVTASCTTFSAFTLTKLVLSAWLSLITPGCMIAFPCQLRY